MIDMNNNAITENVNPEIAKKSSDRYSSCHWVFFNQKKDTEGSTKENSRCACWANEIVKGTVNLEISHGKRICAMCPDYKKRDVEEKIRTI